MLVNRAGLADARVANASGVQVASGTEASGFDRLLAEQIEQAAKQSAEEAKKAIAEAPQESGDTRSAREQLLELLVMCPAERIRFVMLRDRGLTEETLRQLPAEERAKIEAAVEAEIKRQLGGGPTSTGEIQRFDPVGNNA